MGNTVLRFGDPEQHPDQSISLTVRTSKATAIARPPSMKKFAQVNEGERNENGMDWDGRKAIEYVPVKSRTDHFVKEDVDAEDVPKENGPAEPKALRNDDGVKVELDEDGEPIGMNDEEFAVAANRNSPGLRLVGDENTQMAYKYGSTYIPVDKADFEKLQTEKGMDILGFIPQKKAYLYYCASFRS
jgi:ATP-dependent DNA helicase 2 subunit 2